MTRPMLSLCFFPRGFAKGPIGAVAANIKGLVVEIDGDPAAALQAGDTLLWEALAAAGTMFAGIDIRTDPVAFASPPLSRLNVPPLPQWRLDGRPGGLTKTAPAA